MTDYGPLNDVLVVLAAAIVGVAVVQRLRVTPVLGYLVAGIAIGPHALGLIQDPKAAPCWPSSGSSSCCSRSAWTCRCGG